MIMIGNLPLPLVERCAKAVRKAQMDRTGTGKVYDPMIDPTESELQNACAVLRESGHAELVAALKKTRRYVEIEHGRAQRRSAEDLGAQEEREQNVLDEIGDVLRKAGSL